MSRNFRSCQLIYANFLTKLVDLYEKAIKKLEKYIKNKPIDSSENDAPRRHRRKVSAEDTNSVLERNILPAPRTDLHCERKQIIVFKLTWSKWGH